MSYDSRANNVQKAIGPFSAASPKIHPRACSKPLHRLYTGRSVSVYLNIMCIGAQTKSKAGSDFYTYRYAQYMYNILLWNLYYYITVYNTSLVRTAKNKK